MTGPSPPLLVVDPNIWVSAAITGGRGAPGLLLEAAAEGSVTVVVSPHLLSELRVVLERPKFRKFVDALRLIAHEVDDPPSAGFAPACRDPGDNYLVYLAEEVGAGILTSGDQDLLTMNRPGLDVRTARETLDALASRHPWGPG